MFHQLNEPNIF